MYLQMIFNVLPASRDDHTNSFSFLMSPNGRWSFSPAYDLTFSFNPFESYFSQHQIGIKGKTKKIERSDLAAVAKKGGIRRHQEIINTVQDVVLTFSEKSNAIGIEVGTVEMVKRTFVRV
jgi:serine/threonine-protein kinase HipA